MKWTIDQYMRAVIDRIRNSDMDEPLKTQVMSQVDIVEYMGYSIVRIRVTKQNKLTFVGDKVFVRHN
jgi:uncharacterized protein (UPF0333 family)